MTQHQPFPEMLSGGHPNSLGRTIEIVDIVLADQTRLEDLYQCYFDDDAIVRMRTSNAFKRVWREYPDWLLPYIDRFISTIAQIDQDSTRWTIAQLLLELDHLLTDEQRERAKAILKDNFAKTDDWIVLNNTMETLGKWAQDDDDLKGWLKPHLERLANDRRKSVSRKAAKTMDSLIDK